MGENMSDLYSALHAQKGKAYFEGEIISTSLLKVYPDIDVAKGLKGNSRVSGDIDIQGQHEIIDLLITIGARYKLTYKEISYILLCARTESGYNPDAAAGTTTAAGIGQATVAFVDYTLNNSSKRLGFTLDIRGEMIFDAERGCYALVFSFLRARDLVSDFYNQGNDDYWRWIYYLHHDGMSSLRQYHKQQHTLSKEAIDCANDILAQIPAIESLLKTTKIATSFKLSTGDDTPVANKNYVATVSLSQDSSCPKIVSSMNSPLVFFKGTTDGEGKTEAIDVLAGSEIVFTILKDNYKKLAMSGKGDTTNEPKKKGKDKKSSGENREGGEIYTVKSGDTLSAIAKAHGIPVDDLVKLNNLPNANVLHIGQVLKLSDSPDSDSEKGIDYISRFVPKDVKQAIMKYLGIDNGNDKATISYSRSHIALPAGSTSADIDKNKNVVHVKTTTKSTAIKKKQQPPTKHKTDDKGTSKPTTTQNDYEPVIIFARNIRSDLVSKKTIDVLKEILKDTPIHKVTISSTFRTPISQVRAMYENMVKYGIASQLRPHYYKPNGKAVVQVGVDAGGINPEKKQDVIAAMLRKTNEIHSHGGIVSKHCVDEDGYKKKNVIDIGKNSLGQGSLGRILDESIKKYAETNKFLYYISPYAHDGEPAFHLEIDQ